MTTCPSCFTAMADGSSSSAYEPGPFRRIQPAWRLQSAIVIGIVLGAALGSLIERGIGVASVALVIAGAVCGILVARRLDRH